MLELDGSGGGGQLVRTALSLSAVTGEPFRMTGVRGERPEPGLRPQHLAAVRALASITDAEVSDAEPGSETIEFAPGPVRPGRYDVDVGTAGSVPLILDAVLPLAPEIEGPLSLRVRGGTDVKWSPTADYLRRVKLPLLRRYGIGAALDLASRGFYPSGGGDATLSIFPSSPKPLTMHRSDPPDAVWVHSVASADLMEREVAERQAAAGVESLEGRGYDVQGRTVEYSDASSTGSAVTVVLDHGDTIVGGAAVGERGRPAEDVGETAVSQATDSVSGAVVDVHMADQLLVFLALVGGHVTIPTVTDHVETARALIGEFGFRIEIETDGSVAVVRA